VTSWVGGSVAGEGKHDTVEEVEAEGFNDPISFSTVLSSLLSSSLQH
jgi:hypothetical protein